VITGLGIFSPLGQPVSGFGTIETRIDNASAEITADDGTLSITNALLEITALRAADDGVLNITNAWNTNVTDSGVILGGGELRGAMVTVASGPSRELSGNGLVTARIDNQGTIRASGGGTLILDPTVGTNSYFNTTQGFSLVADSANIILRNPGGSETFDARVRIRSGQEIAVEGFRINYGINTQMHMEGGVYRSQEPFSFNGNLIISGSTPSRIVAESTSTTAILPNAELSLAADLELDGPTFAITTTATASGLGSLVVLEESRLLLQDGVDLDVAVVNRGFVSPGTGNFDDPGEASLAAFRQDATGELQVDLAGVAPGFIDLLTVDNNAELDGTLSVSLLNGFEPLLGNNIAILQTTFGNVGGTFATEDFPIFNGLTFDVIYDLDSVVLQVVMLEILFGDADNNLAVSGSDLLAVTNNFGSTGSADGLLLGDADDNGTVSGSDLLAVTNNFGATLPENGAASLRAESSTAAVPEPSAVLLALTAGAMLLARSLFYRCRPT